MTDSTQSLTAVSFGAGTNSTALLVGLVELRKPPDFVLFADTGGEHPHTYAHIAKVNAWLQRETGLEIIRVTNGGRGQGDTLEQNVLMRRELPSKAYGMSGCSVKWKRQPMDRWLKKEPRCAALLATGAKIERLIGIAADEPKRANLPPDKWFVYRYPLIEWGWDRDDCVGAIARAGLEQPGKSACFFCPAMRKVEVLRLAQTDPDLFARAVAIERNAEARVIRGLGRHWSWEALVKADAAQLRLWPDMPDSLPCGCHDGDGADDEEPTP